MKHIKVLQHHIEQGERGNAFWCPIAQAIREQYDVKYDVSVGPVILVDGENWGQVPPKAADFISTFDRNLPVTPFEFDME